MKKERTMYFNEQNTILEMQFQKFYASQSRAEGHLQNALSKLLSYIALSSIEINDPYYIH